MASAGGIGIQALDIQQVCIREYNNVVNLNNEVSSYLSDMRVVTIFFINLFIVVINLAACSDNKTASPSQLEKEISPSIPTDAAPVVPTPHFAPIPTVPSDVRGRKGVTYQLHGFVKDETLPGGSLKVEWIKVSGAGPVEFADPSSPNTTVTFYEPGTYVMRLIASDGEFVVSDDVVIIVKPSPDVFQGT